MNQESEPIEEQLSPARQEYQDLEDRILKDRLEHNKPDSHLEPLFISTYQFSIQGKGEVQEETRTYSKEHETAKHEIKNSRLTSEEAHQIFLDEFVRPELLTSYERDNQRLEYFRTAFDSIIFGKYISFSDSRHKRQGTVQDFVIIANPHFNAKKLAEISPTIEELPSSEFR